MPSLGQTLCQLEKALLNHELGSVVKFFYGKMRGEMAKAPVFVARQRQHSCIFFKIVMNQWLGLSSESDLACLSKPGNLFASFAEGHGKTTGNR